MKKIFLSLFFIIVIVQTNYSQTLQHSKRKQTRAKSFYKMEVDTCSNTPGIIVVLPCDDIRKRIESLMPPGPAFIYPTTGDINTWTLAWSRTLGISIPY